MLRFHLPPNFAAAVVRNAVPLRVELDLSSPPPPELLPTLALLQRWSGTPTPPKFIQLSRTQLRELAAAAAGQPIFVENGTASEWRYEKLLGADTVPVGGVPPPRDPSPAHAKSSGGSTKDQGASTKYQVSSTKSTPTNPQSALRNPQSVGQIENRKSKIENGPAPLVLDGSEHFLAITLPSREHPQYDSAVALLKENGFTLEPSNRKWWLRDRHKTLNFLAAHLTELRERFGAELTPNFEKNTAKVQLADIATDIGTTGGGFSVAIGVRAGDTNESDLRSAIASNRGYVESNGRVFLLDPTRLQKVAAAQRALAGDPNSAVAPRRAVTVSSARAAEVEEILEELSPNFQPPTAWREHTAALRNTTALTPAPLPPALEALLRPYQRLGIAWLWHLRRQNLGGILADEMGLGKTLQALALLAAAPNGQTPDVRSQTSDARGQTNTTKASGSDLPSLNSQPSTLNTRRASLVVSPASLLENWRREAARFTPQLRTFVHHSDRRLASAAEFAGYDVVITSYGTLTRDQTLFTSVEFGCVIADEAQHIKNRRSQNAAALRALRAQSRFLLTGTPVENALDDLRSLFEFLLPGYLTKVPPGLRGDERAWYDERLRAQTAPYILRRTKKSVAPELPDKIEQVIWCELAPAQAALYRETQERSERELFDLEASGASEAKLKFAALTQLLRLRQICCDPRLVNSSLNSQPSTLNSSYPDSAKLDAFLELLEEAIDDGHRVLVFSQFTSLLALLRAELEAQQLMYCYLDGSMPTKARQDAVDQFQKSPDIPLFLLSLKAGGTGLNLTGADTVVHFDPWWNPAAEAQATDRAHRIGQTRTVTTYKLIATGTVEEKVLALQEQKRALLADVFEASDAAAAKLSLTDLRDLMR